MSEQQATPALPTEQQAATENQPQQPDITTQLGNALWNNEQPVQQPPAVQEPPKEEPPKEEFKYVEPGEWLKENYGWESVEAGKAELEQLRKLRETAQTPAERKYANEQSRIYYEAIVNGDEDKVYETLHQKRQLKRLEDLPIANVNEAADIIKANLLFKHKEQGLTTEDVDFLYNKRYVLPAKPQQGSEQSDEDYAAQVEGWKQQVQEKEREIIIEAKLAKPELAKYKSELVLPDIPKVANEQQQVSQEDLAKYEAFKNNFQQKLVSDYQNFKGFSVTAKDGDVQLPVTYAISPEELSASKQMLENLNVNEFLDQRWFDEQGNPKINQMQEDLYLLTNRDKVFQKIANESAAQRYAHHQKIQNNIKLTGVNNGAPPVAAQPDTKAEQHQMAEFLWNL